MVAVLRRFDPLPNHRTHAGQQPGHARRRRARGAPAGAVPGEPGRTPAVGHGTAYGDYETNDYAGEKSSRDPGFGAKVTLSWELDLWGNLRWAKRKGGAEYLASVEDRRAMRMTLVASVAAAYFNLIALDNELSIVRRTLITRSEGLYQVQLRFEGGLTSEMVYQQAKVEYASTAALIPDLERKIKIMENGILLLMGENPDRRVVRGKMNTDAEFADSLPVGLPSGCCSAVPTSGLPSSGSVRRWLQRAWPTPTGFRA